MIFGYRALLTISATCMLPTTAAAGGPLARPTNPEAREHLDRGNRLYNTRSFDEAILEFKAGALIEPAPVFDYNLGQAYRQTGKYQEALWHYDRFLAKGNPTGELLDAVNAFVAEMKAHLANRALTMPPNGPAESSTEPASPPSKPSAAVAPVAPAATPAPSPAIDESAGTNWLGWGLTAVGVASLGASGALFLSSSNLSDQANSTLDQRERGSLHDQAHSRGVVAAAIGAAGLLVTVTGVVDLIVARPHKRTQSTASLDLGIMGHGFAVFGHF